MAADDLRAWEAAGLYDPVAPDADERRELLEYLRDRGATLDDLLAAAADGRLVPLAGELLRHEEPRLTATELAAVAGVETRVVLETSRAAGLPAFEDDVPLFRAADAEAFRVAADAIAVFGERAALEFTRVVGAAMASIADAAMTMFGIEVAGRFDERGLAELEQAAVVEASSAQLTEQVPVAMATLLFHHLEAAIGRGVGRHTVRLAVGFVDLVRSTELVQEIAPEELARVIGDFERHAVAIVSGVGGRVVKTIGDEVMFVTSDASSGCEVLLRLREALAGEPHLPDVRGAVTIGDLVRGYGDFYGPDVTMAARIVKVAAPGQLLATTRIRECAAPRYAFEDLGAHPLRGFAAPVELAELRRA